MYPQKSPKLKTPSITQQIRAKDKEQRIRAKAYQIWEQRGKAGTPEENWNAAIDSLNKERISQLLFSVWHWTGLKDKKGWDLLVQLLTSFSLPLVLFLGGQYFTAQNNNKQQDLADKKAREEKHLADEKAREEKLSKYLDTIEKDLIDLRQGREKSTKKYLDTTRTLTTLSALDGNRKVQLLLFLKNSNLIANKETRALDDKPLNVIELNKADLSNVDLSKVDLSNTDLSGSNLKQANLEKADLSNTNLTNAILEGANLNSSKQNKTTFCNTQMPDGNFNNNSCAEGGTYVTVRTGLVIRNAPAGYVIGGLPYGSPISLTGATRYAAGNNWSELASGGWIASSYIGYR